MNLKTSNAKPSEKAAKKANAGAKKCAIVY